MNKHTASPRYWIARVVRAAVARLMQLNAIVLRTWLYWTVPGLEFTGKGQRIASTASLRPTDNGCLVIGPDVVLCRGVEITVQQGRASVGPSTFIGAWSTIVARCGVSIGRDCLIAERVTIRDQDHVVHGVAGVPVARAGFSTAPIVIGDDVWIGAGAVILKGVTIGRGAVVAANAVVTGGVGEFEIVGGVPARRIGSRRLRVE